ncbi:MAG: LysR family transcriptional regulator [Hyphomicrobiaceae bacterium]|nr:LysR family transcriptional regulator [Hyphomicrobiaceae bacterium]
MNAPHGMDWDDARVLLALSRHGSVRAAARSLQVSHTTVSRRLANLEDVLGARILDRGQTGQLVPTPEGAELLSAAEIAEAQLNEAQRRIQGRDTRLSGVLRVSAYESATSMLLRPHIEAFHANHPDIELELIETNETASLTRREADIALRYALKDPPMGLVGRRIGRSVYALYAAREYLPEILNNTDGPIETLCYTDQPVTLRQEDWFRERFPNTINTLRSNSPAVLTALAKTGPRLIRLPCLYGEFVPELVRLQIDPTDWGHEVWLLTHPDLRHTARVAAFMTFVGDRLISERDLMEGRRPSSKLAFP